MPVFMGVEATLRWGKDLQRGRSQGRKEPRLEEAGLRGTGCGLWENDLHFSFARSCPPPTQPSSLLVGQGNTALGC